MQHQNQGGAAPLGEYLLTAATSTNSRWEQAAGTLLYRPTVLARLGPSFATVPICSQFYLIRLLPRHISPTVTSSPSSLQLPLIPHFFTSLYTFHSPSYPMSSSLSPNAAHPTDDEGSGKEGGKHICPKCPATFTRKSGLKRHLEYVLTSRDRACC